MPLGIDDVSKLFSVSSCSVYVDEQVGVALGELSVAFAHPTVKGYSLAFDSVSTCARILQEVPGLKMHLDFGHANLGRDNGVDFCSHLGSHIKHVHFSDNQGVEDDHMSLGDGNIDWGKAVSALKSIGYDETITLEVFCDDRSLLLQKLEGSRRLLKDLWNR